jgi:hypothetical protein
VSFARRIWLERIWHLATKSLLALRIKAIAENYTQRLSGPFPTVSPTA